MTPVTTMQQQQHLRRLCTAAAASHSTARWLPHNWRSSSQPANPPAHVLRSTAAAVCGSRTPAVPVAALLAVPFDARGSSSNSSSRQLGRRQLTLGAALAAANAGVAPWSRAGAAISSSSSSSSSSRGAAMATAAAAGGSSAGTTDTGIVVVYVTAPNAEVAGSVATALVEAQLAACVNIVPGLTSVYAWKGKVETDSEVLMIIKTQSTLLDSLTTQVKQLHPYDEPEVIALPVVGGSASYMAWVRDSTAAADEA